MWCYDGWPLLNMPGRSGISNAIQDVLNSFAEPERGGSPQAKERRAQSPLRVRQVEWWGQAVWIGPSVLGLSRHGRAQFALGGLSIRQDGRHERWVEFLVASPLFTVPQSWERRQNDRADKTLAVPAAGDLGVEMLARTRILDACCAARGDTPEVAVEAVRLLHQVAFAATAKDVPAVDLATVAARRLFDAGYAEFQLRSHTWGDTQSLTRRHGHRVERVAGPGTVPPPAVLDMTTDVLAGLTQAYRDLGGPP